MYVHMYIYLILNRYLFIKLSGIPLLYNNQEYIREMWIQLLLPDMYIAKFFLLLSKS